MSLNNLIFIVDDDRVTCNFIIKFFQGEALLEILASGEECLEKAPEMKPNVILLDIFMPGINGYEVCKRLRKIPSLTHTKIIIISSKSKPKDKLLGYQSGADDYIIKPLNNIELKVKIRANLKLSALSLERAKKIDLFSDLTKQTRSLCESIQELDVSIRENPLLCGKESNNINNLVQAGEALAKLTEESFHETTNFDSR